MIPDLDEVERLCRRLGPANCWTGCGGTLAAAALAMVRELRERGPAPSRGPRVIGIAGAAGSGKNTVAAMVPDSITIQFADPMYAMVAAMTGIPESVLRDRAFKERPIPALGCSPRRLLQTIGTDCGRRMISPDVWVRLAARRVEQLAADGWATVVLADVRFPNEAEWIRHGMGGQVWRVERPGLVPITDQHASEAGLPAEAVDRVIVNDGDLEQLRAAVGVLCGP
jgi:hypothetical protein